MAEIGNAYISIIPETSKIAPRIKSALDGVDASATRAGKSIGEKLTEGISKSLKVATASIGVAAGGALAMSFAKGFGRLDSIDKAQAKLTGLGNDAQTVSGIMDNSLASVKNTAFGLEEAATSSAGLVAAGIKPGQQLEQTLKTVADTAAIAGTSMTDMGVIFGSVAARGKLQGDDMLQLTSRGVPVLQMLGKELGKTSAEISDMVSEGQIDFATFEKAMRQGVGGSALAMGKTFSGSVANMKAAMGRFGAALLDPAFKAAPPMFNAMGKATDTVTAALKPASERMSNALLPASERLGKALETTLAPALAIAADKVGQFTAMLVEKAVDPVLWERLGAAFHRVAEKAQQVWPQVKEVSAAYFDAVKNISVATWEALADVLNALAPVLRDVLVPVLQKLAEIARDHPGLVGGMVTAWLGMRALGTLTAPLAGVAGALLSIGKVFAIMKFGSEMSKLAAATAGTAPAMSSAATMASRLAKAFTPFGTVLQFIVSPMRALGGVIIRLGSRLVALIPVIGPIIAVVAALGTALWGFFTKTETGRRWWNSLVQAFKDGYAWIKDIFLGVWDSIVDKFNTVKNAAKELFGMATGQDLAQGWPNLADLIGIENAEKVFGVVTNLRKKFREFVDDVKAAWGEVTTALSGGDFGFAGLGRIIGDDNAKMVVNTFAEIGQAARDMWKAVKDSFAQVGKLISDAFADLWKSLKDVGRMLAEQLGSNSSFGKSISDLKKSLGSAFSSVFKGFADAWKALVPAGKAVWEAFSKIGGVLGKILMPVLKVVGAIIGGVLIGGLILFAKVMKAAAWVVEKLAKVFVWLIQHAVVPMIGFFGKFVAFLAGRFVTAINGAGSGVKKTAGFFTTAWRAISHAVKAAWTVIKGVFDAFVYAAKVLVTVVATVVLTPLILAWNLLSWAFKAAWENIIKPTWNALGNYLKWVTDTLIKPAWEGIKFGLQAVGEFFSRVWTAIIKPAWDGLGAGIRWVVDNILAPAWEVIKAALKAVGDAFLWAWNSIIKPVWDGLGAGIRWVVDNIVVPAWQSLKSALQAVGDFFAWVWNSLIKPAWDGLGAGIRWVVDNILTPVWDGIKASLDAIGNAFAWVWNSIIKPVWDGLGQGIQWVADNVVHPVFNGLRDGVDAVGRAFDSVVTWIGQRWNDIKELTAAPIRFFVDWVYNRGIRAAWNMVGPKVGLGELPEARLEFASGGVLPGYTPGRDVHQFIDPRTGLRVDLSGGEGILRPEAVRAMGETSFNALNAAARSGGVSAVKKMLGQGAQFAGGGVLAFADGGIYPNGDTRRKEDIVGRVTAAQDFVRGEHGKPYQWGGVGDPSWDCSGLWSGIVHVINGEDGRSGRLFNTTSFMADPARFGFAPGLNGPVTVGVSADHMAGTLAGINAESASDPKGVQLGGSAWGSDNAYFTNQYTMTSIVGEFLSGMADNVLNSFSLSSKLKAIWDGIINAVPTFDGLGDIAKLPGAFLRKAAESAWNFIKEQIGAFTGRVGTPGSAESWRDMARAAMRRNGFNADDPAQVDAMLAQIQSESGGNPGIAQQIVDVNGTGDAAGVGLLQIIPGTFEAYRDPELPNDRRDPWSNMNAALRYYRSRYGTDLTTMWGQGHGYADGGILPNVLSALKVYDTGGVLPHGGMGINLSGAPEVVVNGPQLQAINNLANNVGALANQVGSLIAQGRFSEAGQVTNEALRKAFPNVAAFIDKAAWTDWYDLANKAGMNFLSDVTDGSVSAWKSMQSAYDAHGKAASVVTEKEKALEEARKELAEAESTSADMTVQDKRKLEDAQRNLDEARRSSGDNAEKVADAEEKLKRVREDIASRSKENAEKRSEEIKKAQEKVAGAELDLTDARSAAMLAAKAAGNAEIEMAIAVADMVIKLIGKITSAVFQAREKVWDAVAAMFGSVKELASMAVKQKAAVKGLRIDFAMAQIEVAAAARNIRLAQIDGMKSQLEATKTVAETQAKFDAQRKADAKAAMGNYVDLSLAFDRFRWSAKNGLDALNLDMVAWSDETHALWAELQGAIIGQELAKKVAEQNTLKATFEHLKAILALRDVTLNLNTATQKLAVLTGKTFGMDSVEATVNERYAKLAAEKAKIQGEQADAKNWLNPAAWFSLYPQLRRRMEQIDREMGAIAARPEFTLSSETQDDIKKITAQAGALGFFGGSEAIEELVKNSVLGDPTRVLDQVKFETELIDLKHEQADLKNQVDKNQAEVDHRRVADPLDALIQSLTMQQNAETTWAEYWRTKDEPTRKALADLAKFQSDSATEVKTLASRPTSEFVVNVPGSKQAMTMDEVDALMQSISDKQDGFDIRLNRLEAPASSPSRIAAALRK